MTAGPARRRPHRPHLPADGPIAGPRAQPSGSGQPAACPSRTAKSESSRSDPQLPSLIQAPPPSKLSNPLAVSRAVKQGATRTCRKPALGINRRALPYGRVGLRLLVVFLTLDRDRIANRS